MRSATPSGTQRSSSIRPARPPSRTAESMADEETGDQDKESGRMGKMTLDEMEALLARHEEAEFNMDVDATMATLVDNPVYELPGLGWHIAGQDAVRETYRRMLPGGESLNIWADKRVHALDDSTLC